MKSDTRIFIAGHSGLVGQALLRRLTREGYPHLLTRAHSALDLCDQAATDAFFALERPEVVFLCAAKVGGIEANRSQPADFSRQNILIQSHVIDACHRYGVSTLIFFGSSCMYPRDAAQPMLEESLMTGPLEPTNEAYATAKLAGMTMCRAYHLQYGCRFATVIPANLYGPHDNFDSSASHVIPALIARLLHAREAGEQKVIAWGSGAPRRDFLFVDDLVDALLFLLRHEASLPTERPMNIGSETGYTIREVMETLQELMDYRGEIVWDTSRPDGAPVKLLESSRIRALGWRPVTELRQGLEQTYRWYQSVRRDRGDI